MSRARPVPPIAEADLPDLPEPVVSCPDCGSLGIRTPSSGEGGIPGTSELMSERVCPRCDYRGPPIEFALREDYAAFLRELNE